jgi:uncharacterized protein (TIGR03435 family)
MERIRESRTNSETDPLPIDFKGGLPMPRFLVGLIAGACAALAQTQKFEVASIKPSDPSANGTSARLNPNGGVTYKGFTLRTLITNVWSVRPFQVTGGPAWGETDRFDVEAKPEKPAQTEERSLMMQELLRDRFQLVVRQETREMPIYHLVLARKDLKFGPQMNESACLPYDREHPPGARDAPVRIEHVRRGETVSQRSRNIQPGGQPLFEVGAHSVGSDRVEGEVRLQAGRRNQARAMARLAIQLLRFSLPSKSSSD